MSEIKQLLPIEYTRGLVTNQILIGRVQKHNVSRALEYLKTKSIYQEEELDHLKRINKDPNGDDLHIVLCSASKQEKLDYKELEAYNISDIHTGEASKYPPFTKEQHELFKVPWPINMKNKGLDLQTFNQKEAKKINDYMRKVIELAKESYLKGNRFNACLLVDPVKDTILLESIDETCRQINSIKHCVMNMADEFGKVCIQANKGLKKVKKNRNESTFVYEGEKEEEKIETKNEDKSEKKLEVNDKRKASQDIKAYFNENYYYCTNLDLYMLMEPCVMCAMALVHSRISRVFYSIPYEDYGTGGLNNDLQLNCYPGLNHKYKVFYNIEFGLAKRVKNEIKTP